MQQSADYFYSLEKGLEIVSPLFQSIEMKTDTWNAGVIVKRRQTFLERIYNSTGLNNQHKLNASTIYICTSCD